MLFIISLLLLLSNCSLENNSRQDQLLSTKVYPKYIFDKLVKIENPDAVNHDKTVPGIVRYEVQNNQWTKITNLSAIHLVFKTKNDPMSYDNDWVKNLKTITNFYTNNGKKYVTVHTESHQKYEFNKYIYSNFNLVKFIPKSPSEKLGFDDTFYNNLELFLKKTKYAPAVRGINEYKGSLLYFDSSVSDDDILKNRLDRHIYYSNVVLGTNQEVTDELNKYNFYTNAYSRLKDYKVIVRHYPPKETTLNLINRGIITNQNAFGNKGFLTVNGTNQILINVGNAEHKTITLNLLYTGTNSSRVDELFVAFDYTDTNDVTRRYTENFPVTEVRSNDGYTYLKNEKNKNLPVFWGITSSVDNYLFYIRKKS